MPPPLRLATSSFGWLACAPAPARASLICACALAPQATEEQITDVANQVLEMYAEKGSATPSGAGPTGCLNGASLALMTDNLKAGGASPSTSASAPAAAPAPSADDATLKAEPSGAAEGAAKREPPLKTAGEGSTANRSDGANGPAAASARADDESRSCKRGSVSEGALDKDDCPPDAKRSRPLESS